MTNLTNTELQAAIDCILQRDSRRFSPQKDHLETLLAEQIRRLNAEEILPKIQPAVKEWEYVASYHSNRSGVRASSRSISDILHGNDTGGTYGIYARQKGTSLPWQLISDAMGILPETVEEIN